MLPTITDYKKLLYTWNFGTAKGAWTLRQLQFQSFKTAGCQRRHVEQMVWRWPRTLIHVHICNGLGQHSPKLVYYKEQVDIQLYMAIVTKYLCMVCI